MVSESMPLAVKYVERRFLSASFSAETALPILELADLAYMPLSLLFISLGSATSMASLLIVSLYDVTLLLVTSVGAHPHSNAKNST